MKKGEKELRALGTLEYREYTSPAMVTEFQEVVTRVEAQSWKAQEGTSIANSGLQRRFYDAMLRAAAGGQRLSGHALFLDGRPIAFILGILDDSGVFLDLKESFSLDFQEFSPGHVLKRLALEQLISRRARIYDFMGKCEPYKMRWTSQTYRQMTVAFYLKTLRGNLAYLRARTQSKAAPMPPPLGDLA